MKTKRTTFRKKLLLILATTGIPLLWIFTLAGNASAHGAGGLPRISYQPLGENYLHAWTSPAIARVGEIHVEALVTDHAFRPMSRSRMIIKVTPLERDAEPIRVMATASNGINAMQTARHEAGFLIEQPGEYEVEITTIAAVGEGGRHNFTMQVVRINGWVKSVMQGILTLLTLAGCGLLILSIRLVQQQRLVTADENTISKNALKHSVS